MSVHQQANPPLRGIGIVVWPVALILFMLLLTVLPQPSQAAATTTQIWQALANNPVTVSLTTPVRNRRSADATLNINLTNSSAQTIAGPLRLVITDLSPANVSISNATGVDAAGEPYFDLTGYVGKSFTPGGNGQINVIVKGGGPTIFTFNTRIEQQITQTQPLSVNITSPATLLTVGSTPQLVTGTVSDPTATVTLNNAPVTNTNGTFQAKVNLTQGSNTIAARAMDSKGNDVTDIISLSLDMTPPYITVSAPQNGDTVRTSTIAVSGLINDIVRGTVAQNQASVTVNGIAATISNRSYLAQNVPLAVGLNTLVIVASDNLGNTSNLSLNVTYQPTQPQHIELVSGQNQTAVINTALPKPLSVKLLDANGKPVVNKPVVFRITQGDGVVGVGSATPGPGTLVNTDSNGIASTSYKLGSRSGVGNQKVRAAAVGFDGEVLFYATANVGAPNKVTINSGNNQRGGVGQPLPEPLVVAVVDQGANVVAGVPVIFQVTQGTGSLQNGQTSVKVVTDSDGRAAAEFTLGKETSLDGQHVTATLVGTNLYAGFTESALAIGATGKTTISGVVLDNQNSPLPSVTVRVDGTSSEALTDAQGQFTITDAPVGAVRLIADGSTTTVTGEWPTLAINIVTIAGANNPLAAPIYLVKLNTATAQTVGAKDVTFTLPEVPGFSLFVKAGSVTFPDGKKTGQISVTPVNASKIPMAPPNGMQPQFIVTIQPVGAQFDPPAPLSLPNVDGHAPGAQVEMYSYDHDLEEFVAIGLGTVSADGTVISSNPGVGVVKAGWHCGSQPNGSGCCTNPGKCQKTDASCNLVNLPNVPNIKGNCKAPLDCQSYQNDDSNVSICNTCVLGVPVQKPLGPATTDAMTFDFSGPLKPINDDLDKLKSVGVILKLNLLQVKGSVVDTPCCNPDTGMGHKIQGSVNGNFGGANLQVKIWPPGPIPTFDSGVIGSAGIASIQFKATFIGGIFAGVSANVNGEMGYKKDTCSKDPNDNAGCFYGTLNTTLTPNLTATIGGDGSLTTTCFFCEKETVKLAIAVNFGNLTWPWNISTVGYNQANCSAGLTGGLLDIQPIVFNSTLSVTGSYSDSSNNPVSINKTFTFLTCKASLASGISCTY
ncbi:carboxypeptidase-like regulatory domain-containing protein [Methylomonas sp. AM2-LC]|uniref:carboxypeptidase-like regulatory domain-containing protein n=1 Tax=Methylomonas sp. AM2-LC TaxID=3153301 RepID=UPI003267515B